mmetsp:Transcript_11321/g.12798  ORF Transcript_11321/g.12798 Transcript_11321/m.12798 type:complete len:181 (+) Transcript_11321:827-1369(+)
MNVIFNLLQKKQLKKLQNSREHEDKNLARQKVQPSNDSSSFANTDDIEVFRLKPVEIKEVDNSSSIYDSDEYEDESYNINSPGKEETKSRYYFDSDDDESVSSSEELHLQVMEMEVLKNKFSEDVQVGNSESEFSQSSKPKKKKMHHKSAKKTDWDDQTKHSKYKGGLQWHPDDDFTLND